MRRDTYRQILAEIMKHLAHDAQINGSTKERKVGTLVLGTEPGDLWQRAIDVLEQTTEDDAIVFLEKMLTASCSQQVQSLIGRIQQGVNPGITLNENQQTVLIGMVREATENKITPMMNVAIITCFINSCCN
jgi:hypothetical protein